MQTNSTQQNKNNLRVCYHIHATQRHAKQMLSEDMLSDDAVSTTVYLRTMISYPKIAGFRR